MIDLNANFFLQIINFIIIYLVLRRFLFEPITNFMNERSESISNKIEGAKSREEEAERLKQEYQKRIEDAKREAQEIVEDSRRRAQRTKEDIINEAKVEANSKLERAEKEIRRAKEQAIESLKDEVASISIQMTKELLEKSINKEVQKDSIDAFISKLDKDKLGEIQ
ncbi:F0F1 ATP synthase subunit B [Halonatronum saccharophilum]|uniref:F0F1 ATP synthase subunit B n=1 Tax=Halonatronum saccharophilum TaxID=150060 RepID=UPI000484C991|nr:F0F1 ATP synthase subunit B [Halonatronum saccharophilum]